MEFSKNRVILGNMFDEISSSYDLINHVMSCGRDIVWRNRGVKYLKTLNRKYGCILDLAAGSGDLGKAFLKLKPEKMFSADLSERMLQRNRQKIGSEVNIQIKADAEYLPFADNYFDLCGIAFGIRNFENLEKCICEINRVLKKDAVLFIIEMFKPVRLGFFSRAFRLYFNNIMPYVGNFISRSANAYDYLRSSVEDFLPVESFISIAEQNGFTLINKTDNFSGVVYSVCLKKN